MCEKGNALVTREFKPKGVCSVKITYNIEENHLTKVEFLSGCPGNTMGVSKLVEGLTPEEVVKKLRGIKCGFKNTSCPDQLAQAMEAHIRGK